MRTPYELKHVVFDRAIEDLVRGFYYGKTPTTLKVLKEIKEDLYKLEKLEK